MDKAEAARLVAALRAAKLPTPGLKWRPRAGGAVPYWYPDPALVKSGYPVKSANLGIYTDPLLLSQRCVILQEEALQWKRDGLVKRERTFDGMFGSLIDKYLDDPRSPFNTTIRPQTKVIYGIYAARLKTHIGEIYVDDCNGTDLQCWFDVWADREDPNNPRSPFRKLGRGRMVLAVLQAAVRFSIICQKPSSQALKVLTGFQTIMREVPFPALPPRTAAPTAEQIIAARTAAHAAGRSRRALCYAIQYETHLRQWDVTGIWVPLSDLRPSAIIDRGEKWLGPTWADIGEDMSLTIRPEKTRDTTGKVVTFDLSVCPMILEEIAMVPLEQRTGPLIVDEPTGLPYARHRFRRGWRGDFKAAGIPRTVWNRDIRAGGNTEASKAGVSKEDRAKVSGHSERMAAEVYDRDTVEAHRRVMAARTAERAKGAK